MTVQPAAAPDNAAEIEPVNGDDSRTQMASKHRRKRERLHNSVARIADDPSNNACCNGIESDRLGSATTRSLGDHAGGDMVRWRDIIRNDCQPRRGPKPPELRTFGRAKQSAATK